MDDIARLSNEEMSLSRAGDARVVCCFHEVHTVQASSLLQGASTSFTTLFSNWTSVEMMPRRKPSFDPRDCLFLSVCPPPRS